ncbi:MAG: DMT family transporter [Leptothrix sp. (in: b-proteobacteria)]
MSAARTAGQRQDTLAIGVLLFSCTLWGLMWWPLKQFAAGGLQGPLLTALSYGAAALAGLPLLWRERSAWRAQATHLIGLAVVGGFANSAFVQALVLGDVVRVMLLFYLSPVWAVLGGRLFLNERVSARRAGAVALALAGAFMVVGGTAAFDAPLSAVDWLSLVAGMAFAGNNLIARAAQAIPMPSKAIAVFIGCAGCAAAVCAFGATPQPGPASAGLWIGVLGFGLVWVLVATVTWQYGVTHLEAGRSGVILIAELLVAVASAVLIGGAVMSPGELIGGALIAAAALLEATAPAPIEPPPVVPAATT